MRYLPYLTGMLVATLVYALGVWTGRKITRDAIDAAVRIERTKLLLDQAEVRRMSIGRLAGMIDGEGQTIKLLTPSALRRLSDDDLSMLATRRGIMTMGLMGDRQKIITAIQAHQKSIMPAWAQDWPQFNGEGKE
jgi:hypothetical protein